MNSLMKRLSEAAGPPGFETQVRALIQEEIASLIDELQVDNLGSLIVRKGSRSAGGLKMMLAAHMDEPGLMVSHVDAQGFARFVPLGRLSQQSSAGSRVRFLAGQQGLIGAEKISEEGSYPPFDRMFIDSGASSRKDCPLRVGDVAVLDRPFSDLQSCWVGKALDDRVGVLLLIETLRSLVKNEIHTPHELYFVFSAQQGIGSRGAATAAYQIEPDLALEVGLCESGDTPGGPRTELEIGKGPAIKLRDRSDVYDPRLVRWMVSACQAAGLPYQKEVSQKNFLESNPIPLSRGGVPTGGISIPARYLRSGSELVHVEDVGQALKLLAELVRSPFDLGN